MPQGEGGGAGVVAEWLDADYMAEGAVGSMPGSRFAGGGDILTDGQYIGEKKERVKTRSKMKFFLVIAFNIS